MSALAGKRVVNTRAPHQAAELNELLRARGAEPLAYPCIRIEPPQDCAPLDEALRRAAGGGFDWLLLTSANAVHAVAQRLAVLSGASLPADLRLGAIGRGTGRATERELGRAPDLLPDEAIAESLLAALRARSELPGTGTGGASSRVRPRILLPQGDLARPLLARELAVHAQVEAVQAYRTVLGEGGVDLPRLLRRRQVDAVVLTSPSTARNLLLRLGPGEDCRRALAEVPAACIGPVTAAAAAALGSHILQPGEHSLTGVVDALEAYFSTMVVPND
jgi:uroporphyrinogen-III synthase